jgi:hypothetical protein
MPKYIYCITREETQLNLNNLEGIDGTNIEQCNFNGLSCIVSEVTQTERSLDKASVMAHQKALEAIMEMATIIPVAFGHIVESTEEIQTKLLGEQNEKLHQTLSNLDGKIELGLKAYFVDLQRIFKEISDSNEEIKRMKASGKVSRNDQIRAGEIAARALSTKKALLEERMLSCLEGYLIERKQCNLFADEMISNLAFLVDRKHLEEMDKRVNGFYNELDDDNIIFKYVGPVPPYNFVDIRINAEK